MTVVRSDDKNLALSRPTRMKSRPCIIIKQIIVMTETLTLTPLPARAGERDNLLSRMSSRMGCQGPLQRVSCRRGDN